MITIIVNDKVVECQETENGFIIDLTKNTKRPTKTIKIHYTDINQELRDYVEETIQGTVELISFAEEMIKIGHPRAIFLTAVKETAEEYLKNLNEILKRIK